MTNSERLLSLCRQFQKLSVDSVFLLPTDSVWAEKHGSRRFRLGAVVKVHHPNNGFYTVVQGVIEGAGPIRDRLIELTTADMERVSVCAADTDEGG